VRVLKVPVNAGVAEETTMGSKEQRLPVRVLGQVAALVAFFGLLANIAVGGNGVVPGEVIQEAPTVACLGVRWLVTGDDNRTAQVRVSFRREGAGAR
jgi:hypothetical protein